MRAAVGPTRRRAEPETVDGVPVLAEVRALERGRPLALPPAVQAAAVAATGFVAGAATVVAISARRARPPAARRRRRRARDAARRCRSLGTRSFLVDVHLLGRGE